NNFRLGIADATIQGRVIDDASGDTVSGIWGYAFAESATSFNQGPMMGTGMGGPVSSSSFTLKVPAGSYRVGVDFPSESSGYTTADMAAVTAVSGATANVDVRVKPNNATIRVRFKNTSGNLITDLNYAEVFLDNGSGGHQWKHFSSSDLSSGLANILVSAGNWRVGYNIDPTTSSYMSEPSTNNQVTAVASQIVIKDITLRSADSVVSGTVYDPSGNPLPGVLVSTDSRKASSFSGSGRPMFMQGKTTGSDGAYSLTLPAGTYQVAAFFPPEAVVSGQTVNYLNPDPSEVTISSSSPATANFTFKQSDATLSGSITLNGQSQGAFVSAYSSAGGYNETTSASGSYSL
ncbi:MAG TPA: carboxypeptidase-like regulatory domain-containing protein, partial [Candidatus Babeliales bacterium]|nr:carboxypeptidase-like regulatory domain-containing protein [Candidatus Babeliales bacterium]